MTIKEKALTWWGKQIKQENYVVAAISIDRRQREYLQKHGYLFAVSRKFYLLKRPEDEGSEVFPLLYWQAIQEVLSAFNWSVRSNSALQVLNGDHSPQKSLLVRTEEKTNKKISLPAEFSITMQFDTGFDERLVNKVNIADRKIPVDIPERVLIDISRIKSRDAVSFVSGTKFDPRVLDALYAKNPKPVVYRRLIELANEAKRPDLAARLRKTIEYHTSYQVIRKKKEANIAELDTPAVISPAWVIRQEERIKEYDAMLTNHVKTEIAEIKTKSISQLLKEAIDHKRYDTYHSTSLEGYKITPKEVDALLSGQPPEDAEEEGEEYFEKLRNRMAILGYSEAFDFVLDKVKSDFKNPSISEDLIKDTYYNLFKPSADAGVVDYFGLTPYRKMPVYIRGSRHAPPSYEKLPDLMANYTTQINQVKNPVVRAILAHYFFVAIHPYVDGNGRTARLLMNYCLLSTGYTWVTIKTEQRDEYFETLSKADSDEDILPFGRFIVEMLKEASKDTNNNRDNKIRKAHDKK